MNRIPLLAPPLPEQRAIAHILGTLDDKIELNRRMNETLEAMARALFKSWFVDFDPVRAKAEGRDPGLPKPLADLFPDSFEDSELGEIPKGWEVGTLGDVAEHPRRGSSARRDRPLDTPYIALEHMPKRCIALSDWGMLPMGWRATSSSSRRGEILFGKLRPYFHKVGVAPVDGVCSTDIVVVAPEGRSGSASCSATSRATSSSSTRTPARPARRCRGTSWGEMARYEVVLPPRPVAEAFTDQVRPLVDRIIAGIHESRTLAALRDTLLPKLISGELAHRGCRKVRDEGRNINVGPKRACSVSSVFSCPTPCRTAVKCPEISRLRACSRSSARCHHLRICPRSDRRPGRFLSNSRTQTLQLADSAAYDWPR